ncbi:MAG: hypothetical protein HKN91_05620, partial [Acidimicrobiia bacterium]|nr:hypothetical protein [Acidimicrobiia bacterium]
MLEYDSPFNRFPANRHKSPGPAMLTFPTRKGPVFYGFSSRRVPVLALAFALLGLGCGASSNALDRASPEVQEIVADVNSANPPLSYRFKYSPISTVFMACLSGVEDVDGVVDAERRIMTLTSRQRPGAVYSLDGELLIHRDLLDGATGDTPFARVGLDAATDQETRNRIDASLGTSLAALVAQGA